MEPLDRIAAYLAGDLTTADAAAVEEELARDPELRARVAAMRRADDVLERLRSPEPPAGFEDRLRDHLQPVVAEQLGAAEPTAAVSTFDELSRRREARRFPWAPALGGVAAAALALVVFVNLGGGDDGLMSADMDVAEDEAGQMETFADDADDAADGGMAEMAAPEPPDGPVIVASDRVLDDDDLAVLLGSNDLAGVTGQGLDPVRGAEVATSWTAALGVDAPRLATPETEEQPADDADAAAEEESAVVEAPLRETGDRALTSDDRADIQQCLAEILTDDTVAIPSYVELGSYDGEDVIVFGLVTVDPATGAFTRAEIWVTARETCDPRQLLQ